MVNKIVLSGSDLRWSERRPYKIVNLLEMLRLFADKFVQLTSAMAANEIFARHAEKAATFPKVSHGDPMLMNLQRIKTICVGIELPVSADQADKIINRIQAEDVPYPKLEQLFEELQSRITDELKAKVFLVLRTNQIDHYKKPMLFGEKVFTGFPSASFDIEEAGKCYALDRNTACVMHLQRVLEIGLKGYGSYLGIASLASKSEPSWNTILDQTRKEIKERDCKTITTKVWKSTQEKKFCEGIQPFLEAVKTAWRNPSMHADRTYTEETAKEIYDSVKAFMRHLAEHLDEKGKFWKKPKKAAL